MPTRARASLSVIQMLRRAAREVKGRVLLGGAVVMGPPRPEVALTFDDGPSRAHTPAILDVLRRRRVRATFFVLGAHVEQEPEIARRVAAEHEIGCHSYSHAREVVQGLARFREDVTRCRAAFEGVLGVRPRYYRFPWGDPGRISPKDVEWLFGMTCVHWSGGGGEEHGDADAIVRGVERALDPGAILLLHDGLAPGSIYPRPRDATVAALPRVLDAIAARGLRAVSVGELLDPAGGGACAPSF